jgi:hypothetical protein
MFPSRTGEAMRRLIDRPIRSPEAQALLEGKVTAAELRAKDQAKAAAKIERRRLRINPSTKPLSLAEQRARSRWYKPLPAILAEALAVNQGLLDRLSIGVHSPNQASKEQYQIMLNGLYQATQQQLEALDIFGEVDWSEGE